MIIQSDNKALKKELLSLEKLLTDNGAWFDDALSIICDDQGSLSIQMAAPKNQGEDIIKVPDELLVPANPLNITVKGGTFSVDPEKGKLSPIQIEIGKCMIEIYNLTGKAEFHKNNYPWITHRKAPAFMDKLTHARTPNDIMGGKQSFLHSLKGAKSMDEFICDSFIHTRVLGHKESSESGKVQKIMPIIDYLNHDFRASPFILSDPKAKKKGLMRILNSQPFLHTRECYVVYGVYDAVDTFFSYGFPDTHAPFVRSVPVEVPVRGTGKLIISALPGARHEKELDKQIQDLRRFMPVANKKEDGDLEMSHLIIPAAQAPQAMRRVLRLMIRALAGDSVTPQYVVERVYEAEEVILKTNIDFYKKLVKDLEANKKDPVDMKNQILEIAKAQLNKLYKYHRDDAMMKAVKEGKKPEQVEAEKIAAAE